MYFMKRPTGRPRRFMGLIMGRKGPSEAETNRILTEIYPSPFQSDLSKMRRISEELQWQKGLRGDPSVHSARWDQEVEYIELCLKRGVCIVWPRDKGLENDVAELTPKRRELFRKRLQQLKNKINRQLAREAKARRKTPRSPQYLLKSRFKKSKR
ncbi:MAG: hypothetical protein WC634_00880 [archaeon]